MVVPIYHESLFEMSPNIVTTIFAEVENIGFTCKKSADRRSSKIKNLIGAPLG